MCDLYLGFFFDLQDLQTGEIIFYLKGADVVMSAIVQYTDWLDEEVGNMARDGLRTLVVARKMLTEEQYLDFEVSYAIFFLYVAVKNCIKTNCSCFLVFQK